MNLPHPVPTADRSQHSITRAQVWLARSVGCSIISVLPPQTAVVTDHPYACSGLWSRPEPWSPWSRPEPLSPTDLHVVRVSTTILNHVRCCTGCGLPPAGSQLGLLVNAAFFVTGVSAIVSLTQGSGASGGSAILTKATGFCSWALLASAAAVFAVHVRPLTPLSPVFFLSFFFTCTCSCCASSCVVLCSYWVAAGLS